jgi:hypothetical protein
MKTNYEKQATDFLEKTGCKMTITYKENRKYFPDDKGKRDVYEIEIVRGSRKWKFEFGNSIADSGFYAMTGKRRTEIDLKWLAKSDWDLRFTIGGGHGQVKSDYIHRPKAPSSYSILACLTTYDVGTLEDFCSEFGYDSDSKTADRVYAAVCEEYLNVCRIWNDSEIEELCEIQ